MAARPRRVLLFDDDPTGTGLPMGTQCLRFLDEWDRFVVRPEGAPEPPTHWPADERWAIDVPELPADLSGMGTVVRYFGAARGYLGQLRKFVRKARPHLIIAGSFQALLPLAVRVPWGRIPVVHLLQRQDLPEGGGTSFLLGSTPYHLARSKDALAQLPGSCRETSGVLRLAVHGSTMPQRANLRSVLKWEGTWMVGCIGPLIPEKNLRPLIEALSLSRGDKLLDDARLIFVGEGPERAALQEQARQLGIYDRIHFAGDRGDLPALLPTFDAVVDTALCECGPPSLAEAQIAGLPVLSTPASGLRELVEHGRVGIMTTHYDAGAIFNGLKLLREQRRGGEMSIEAQSIASRRHDPTRLRQQLLDYVESILAPGKPRRT